MRIVTWPIASGAKQQPRTKNKIVLRKSFIALSSSRRHSRM